MSKQVLKFDALIVGAGVIGSAVAMSLVRRGMAQVGVIDLDLGGEWSSSELNAGGVRATWSQRLNLHASKKSIEYFSSVDQQVGYRPVGYLWMHRPETWKPALKSREMHVQEGWPVEIWDPAELQRRIPFVDKVDDLAGALFGVRDGLVNPNRLKEHYREEAIRGGARFLDGTFLRSVQYGDLGARVHAFQFKNSSNLPSVLKKKVLTEAWTVELEAQGETLEFLTSRLINCAGAWSASVAKKIGYDAFCEPVRRQISLFHARDVDLSPYGMMIDPSGVYFHPEAIYGLAGYATPNESVGFNFDYDAELFFESHIWPALYERASVFERLRHVSGWAGLYENSPDHHAIVGEVSDSRFRGARVFEAHSFSGHGVMQSYAVGEGLAEKVVFGKYDSLDLSPWDRTRFQAGRTFDRETWVI